MLLWPNVDDTNVAFETLTTGKLKHFDIMKSLLRPLCFLLILASASYAEDDIDVDEDAQKASSMSTAARILVSKQIQNRYLVEGKDVVVKYGLYNVGRSAAVNVQLDERGFGQDDFDVIAGSPSLRLDRLAPGANNTHVLVVRPKKFGYFNFTAAAVKYTTDDDGGERFGFSSDPGQGLIISLKEYEKTFSAHVLDWAAFAVMTLPSLGIPFLLWHSSKSKYEAIARSKKSD